MRRLVIDVPKISPDQTLQRLGDSLRQPQTAKQLVVVPGFEFVFVRRVEGAISIAVCRAAGHTWAMRVHDTGWSDTADPGRHTNTGHTVWTSLRPCVTQFQELPINSGWCLSSVHQQSGGYRRYAAETGTHSVKLRISGVVIDMPVVVHVKVVDFLVVAQRSFPLVQFSRPLRFPSCSPLIR